MKATNEDGLMFCPKCTRWLHPSGFISRFGRPTSLCADCRNYKLEWYWKNREAVNEKSRLKQRKKAMAKYVSKSAAAKKAGD